MTTANPSTSKQKDEQAVHSLYSYPCLTWTTEGGNQVFYKHKIPTCQLYWGCHNGYCYEH